MVYMTNITTVLEEVYQTIESWIEHETEEEGILEDINSFIKPQLTDEIIEPPYIWFEKGDIEPYKESLLANNTMIRLPVRFICAYEPDEDDFYNAERYALNIASRIIAVVQKHHKRRSTLSHILKAELEMIQPNGNVQIINKQDIVPAVRVGFNFIIKCQWMECIIEDEIQEIENIGDNNNGS